MVNLIRNKSSLSKVKKMAFHIGFWSAVSGIIIINSLSNGIYQEKRKNAYFDE